MSETKFNSSPAGGHWSWALALAGIVVLASGNNPAVPPVSFVGIDKVAHFGVFGLLATALLRVPAVWRRGAWRGWIAVAAVSLFGATDEWHQSYTPGRSVEFADWIADTSGASLAVVLYLHWVSYRRLLSIPLRLGRRKRALQSAAPAATPSCASIEPER